MMRTIYRLEGKMIDINAPCIIGDVSYPHLRDVWESIGVVQAQVDDYPDTALFNVTEDEAGELTIEPKTEEQLAVNFNSHVQQEILALENSITNRMWREDSLGSTDVNPKTGMTATQTIADVDQKIVALKLTLRKIVEPEAPL